MKFQNILVLLIPCALFFTGCATTLSKGQKENLNSISVSQPIIEKDAYHEPNARSRERVGASDAGGMYGGFIGSLVGSAIEAGIKESQQDSFEAINEQYFNQIEDMMPESLEQQLMKTIQDVLSKDPILGEKVVEKSRNSFESRVKSYGLLRQDGAEGDDVRLDFAIQAKVKMLNEKDRVLFSQFFLAESRSAYKLSEYVEDPKLLEKVYRESLDDLAHQFSKVLLQQ